MTHSFAAVWVNKNMQRSTTRGTIHLLHQFQRPALSQAALNGCLDWVEIRMAQDYEPYSADACCLQCRQSTTILGTKCRARIAGVHTHHPHSCRDHILGKLENPCTYTYTLNAVAVSRSFLPTCLQAPPHRCDTLRWLPSHSLHLLVVAKPAIPPPTGSQTRASAQVHGVSPAPAILSQELCWVALPGELWLRVS